MRANLLLVLTVQPLTRHNFIRLGVNTKYKNWKIIYWNVLPLINLKIYKLFTRAGSRHKKNINYKEIFSLFDLIKKFKNIPKNFFYLNLGGDILLTSILDRCLFFLGGKKISFNSGGEVNLKFYTKKNITNYINKNNFFKIVLRTSLMFYKKIINIISLKIGSTKPALGFAFNSNIYKKIKKQYREKNLIKIDAAEVELFLKNKKKTYKHKNIVFIDDVVENSFDYKLGYAQDDERKAEDYWDPIKEFLNLIKLKFTDHKIIIAAHHRRNKNDKPINEYKFFFDKTSELIKNSKLVLCHNSLACQIAVLYKKPIIFLTSDYYKNFHYHSYLLTKQLAKTLGTQCLHIEKKLTSKSLMLKKFQTININVKKYENYRKKYIQFPELKTYGRWKTILKHLDDKRFIKL
jgi:hypothetical protein